MTPTQNKVKTKIARQVGIYFSSWETAQEWIAQVGDVKGVNFLDISVGKEKMSIKDKADFEHKQYPAKKKNTWFIYFGDL